MIEQREYEAFAAYPANAGTVSRVRPVDTTAGSLRVTLQGAGFTVRVQISNAQPGRGDQPHLFLPPENSWETHKTVTAADPPTLIPAPVRWIRLIVDDGSVAGGNIAESSKGITEITAETLKGVGTALADVVQNTILMQQAAGVGRVATDADLVGKPAGAYELTSTNERLIWTGTAIQAGSRGPMLDPARPNVARAGSGGDLTATLDAAIAAGKKGIELVAGVTYTMSASVNLPPAFVVAGPSVGQRPTIKITGDIPTPAPLFGSTVTGTAYSRGTTLRNLYIDLEKKVDYGVDVGDMVSWTLDNVQIINARVNNIRGRVAKSSSPYNGYNDFRNVLTSGAGQVALEMVGETNQCTFVQGSANASDIGLKITAGWNNFVACDMSSNRINCQIGAENTTVVGYTELAKELDHHILPTAKNTTILGYRASLYLPTGVVNEGENTHINGIHWRNGGTARNLVPNGKLRAWRPDGLPDIPWRAPDVNWNSLTKERVGDALKLTSTAQFANAKINLQTLLAPYAGQRVTVGFLWSGAAANSLTSRQLAVFSGGASQLGRAYTGATGKTPERHRTTYVQPMWLTFDVPATPTDMYMMIEVSNTTGSIGDSITLHGLFVALGNDVFPLVDTPPEVALAGGGVSVYRSGVSGADAYHLIGNISSTQRMMLRLQAGAFSSAASDFRDDTLELGVRNNTLLSSYRTYGPGNRTTTGFAAYAVGDGTWNVYMVTRGTAYVQAAITAYRVDQLSGATVPLAPGAATTAAPTGTLSLDTTAAGYAPTAADVLGVGAVQVQGKQVVGAQQPAIANATDAATTQTQLNALLAALRTHGLIAP